MIRKKYFMSLNVIYMLKDGPKEEFEKNVKTNLFCSELNNIQLDKEYKIQFYKQYWDEDKIYNEMMKYYVTNGMYDLCGTRFSVIDMKKLIEELQPYDYVMEIERCARNDINVDTYN